MKVVNQAEGHLCIVRVKEGHTGIDVYQGLCQCGWSGRVLKTELEANTNIIQHQWGQANKERVEL